LNILVVGETGTGKELIVRRIVEHPGNTKNTFIPVNCAEFSENLLASELFGHKKGAFTDATAPRNGLLKTCDGGVLFLDELGSMPQHMQAQLLRVIERGTYKPVGSDKIERLAKGIRIFAATNDADNIREDLKWRFQEHIYVPPLRERLSDVFAIMQGLLYDKKQRDKTICPNARWAITREELVKLVFSLWPGNVRELKNAVDRSIERWKFANSKTEYILFQYAPDAKAGELFQDARALMRIWGAMVEAAFQAHKQKLWDGVLDNPFGGEKEDVAKDMPFLLSGFYDAILSRHRATRDSLYGSTKPKMNFKPFLSCTEAVDLICLIQALCEQHITEAKHPTSRHIQVGDVPDIDIHLAMALYRARWLDENKQQVFSLPPEIATEYDLDTLGKREPSSSGVTPDLTSYTERELLSSYYTQLLGKYETQKAAANAAGIKPDALHRRIKKLQLKDWQSR
jgi:transcriptional regulator with GAF, ATPase, and Fis domain